MIAITIRGIKAGHKGVISFNIGLCSKDKPFLYLIHGGRRAMSHGKSMGLFSKSVERIRSGGQRKLSGPHLLKYSFRSLEDHVSEILIAGKK